jgi:hypothetical protein
MPATGPKADLAPRPSGEAATLEAGQATHGATAGAVPAASAAGRSDGLAEFTHFQRLPEAS